ncbi:MAG: RES family NAD+ phosphorylase [Candidatus Acidiferrales bacterium]
MALPPDLPRSPLSAVVFRVVREGLDPLATIGSLKAGGRFNSPNEFGALYTSLEAATAAKEVARGLRQRGVDPDQFPEGAWWVYDLEVKLESVLDLTDTNVLQRSGIVASSLTGSDIIATREIAAEARERGYEALLVPSAAAPGSGNLVIFLDKVLARLNVLSSRPMSFREERR